MRGRLPANYLHYDPLQVQRQGLTYSNAHLLMNRYRCYRCYMSIHALSIAQVAEAAGLPVETVRTLRRRGQLPEPDVVIGEGTTRPQRGWMAETIDRWMATREAAE